MLMGCLFSLISLYVRFNSNFLLTFTYLTNWGMWLTSFYFVTTMADSLFSSDKWLLA